MRYLKPDATRLSRAAKSTIEFGDYMFFGMGGFLAATMAVIGLCAMWTEGFLLLLLALPALIMLGLVISWARNTVNLGTSYSGDPVVSKAETLYNQLRGDFTEPLALPIYQKIFNHAAEGHLTFRDGCNTGACDDRIKVLARLVPATQSVHDKSDMQAAIDFIEDRRSLGA